MSAKHTPGPWMLEASGIRVLTAPGRSPIDMRFSALTKEQDKANARLIAAAPDLLAALKEAASELEYGGATDLASRFGELIAKAEGGV